MESLGLEASRSEVRGPQYVMCVVSRRSFAPSLAVLCYKGDKERRAELQREADTQPFTVLLTTYEVQLPSRGGVAAGGVACVPTDGLFLPPHSCVSKTPPF